MPCDEQGIFAAYKRKKIILLHMERIKSSGGSALGG